MDRFWGYLLGTTVAAGMGGCGILSAVMSQSWKGSHTTQMVSAVDNLTLLIGVGVMGGLFILAFGIIFVLYMRMQHRVQGTVISTEPRGRLTSHEAPALPPVKNAGTWVSNRNRNVQEIEGDFYELE